MSSGNVTGIGRLVQEITIMRTLQLTGPNSKDYHYSWTTNYEYDYFHLHRI